MLPGVDGNVPKLGANVECLGACECYTDEGGGETGPQNLLPQNSRVDLVQVKSHYCRNGTTPCCVKSLVEARRNNTLVKDPITLDSHPNTERKERSPSPSHMGIFLSLFVIMEGISCPLTPITVVVIAVIPLSAVPSMY